MRQENLLVHPRIRPVAAMLAVSRLFRNPEDTRQVFLLTQALPGPRTMFDRFYACETGQAVLAERRSLLAALADRARLAALPPGTLGARYAGFMAQERLSAEGLERIGRENLRLSADDRVQVYAARMRDMHDLYHVLTGYGRDELGEVCILAFSYPQQKIPSFRVISVLGMLRLARILRKFGVSPLGVAAAVREAGRHGRAAAWLPGEDLEAMLEEDLEVLRQRLKIPPPLRYRQVIARWRAAAA